MNHPKPRDREVLERAASVLCEAIAAKWRKIAYPQRGRIPPPVQDPDTIPAILSPGRSTTLRPGETLLEATERLTEGTDL